MPNVCLLVVTILGDLVWNEVKRSEHLSYDVVLLGTIWGFTPNRTDIPGSGDCVLESFFQGTVDERSCPPGLQTFVENLYLILEFGRGCCVVPARVEIGKRGDYFAEIPF
jgi:hypothetical protein